MRWLQTEYILKGLYLGLVLDFALLVSRQPDPGVGLYLLQAGCLAAGLVLALVAAATARFREGYRLKGPVPSFVAFLMLESPSLIYLGLLGGAFAASVLGRRILAVSDYSLFVYLVGAGAGLGVLIGALRQVRDTRQRVIYSLVMAAAMLLGAAYLFGLIGGREAPVEFKSPTGFAVALLVGLPGFYVLTFAGKEEESEVEVGALCGALGLCFTLLTGANQLGLITVVLPVMLYFWYTWRVMPHLRVSKHALRGFGHFRAGRHRRALLSFRRALDHEPNNELARAGFWEVHVSLNLQTLADDPHLLALVDFGLCLERAGSLLVEPNPGPEKLDEANRLLQLVVSQRPQMQPRADYWRAVALVHRGELVQASEVLAHLLDPTVHRDQAMQKHRQVVLLQAWQLALLLHPELRERVGKPQLAQPGRRLEAIAAVERYIADNGDDGSLAPLKRLLYHDLTEEEYQAAKVADQALPHFDYGYVEQLGMALVGDDERWERGGVFLRIAAHGQPTKGPSLFVQIAQALQRAGLNEQALHNYELAKRAGISLGHKNMAEPERNAYFTTLKLLGEKAMERGDVEAAIENFRLYSEWERSGVPTLRILADLYEQRGDALAALRTNDRALMFDGKDGDLLARKDRYYYSLEPEVLAAHAEAVGPGFDVDYCVSKARAAIDAPNSDLDLLDWGQHLLRLALVLRPDSRGIKLLLARALARRGEIEEAVRLLEENRSPKPEKFAGGDDEEAWYSSCQMLGDLYLNNMGRADLAIPCLNDYRKSTKSGARTWLRLGQAYEQVGDRDRAVKCYGQAAAYEGNPLSYEASEALSRLGSA